MAAKCAIYKNLLRIAGKLRPQGYLRHFQGDLIKHDKRALKNYCGPYLWAITGSSTHLLTPEGACVGKNHSGAWKALSKGEISTPSRVYYSSDGTQPPKRVSGAIPGQIAQKWERACTVRFDPWTGRQISKAKKR